MTDEAVFVCSPPFTRVRRVLRCIRCHARRRHVVTLYEWYGPITICCHCGAYRNDGELRRPTNRDAREARLARALWPSLPRWQQ